MKMTIKNITSSGATERGAFSEIRHSLHLAVTLVPCTKKIRAIALSLALNGTLQDC